MPHCPTPVTGLSKSIYQKSTPSPPPYVSANIYLNGVIKYFHSYIGAWRVNFDVVSELMNIGLGGIKRGGLFVDN